MAKYLYNGVEAPAMPVLADWEQETYPIAMINKNGRLVFCTSIGNADADGKVTVSVFSTLVYEVVDGQWVKQSINPMNFKPVWTNTDILNEDGTIYLAATIPLPDQLFVQNNESWIYKENAWSNGGNFCTLPLPNTIDFSVYKYLYLKGNVGAQCRLFATDKPLYYKRGSSAFVTGYLGAKEPVSYLSYSYDGVFDVGGTELWIGGWDEPSITEVANPNDDGYYVVLPVYPSAQSEIRWSNTVVYKTDDTVLLTPFEPVLSRSGTTAEPIDKASFLQGWLVGRRLAGMRNKTQ